MDRFWQVTSGTWSTLSNWGGTLPTAGDTAYIVNSGTANVTGLGATCGTLSLGNGGGSGTVLMSAGSFPSTAQFVGFGGSGSFMQSGGTHSVSSVLYVGYSPFSYTSGFQTGTGTCNLSGGGLLSAGEEDIGAWGTASFTQSGGTNAVSGNMIVGSSVFQNQYVQDGNGMYKLSGRSLLSAVSEDIGGSLSDVIHNAGTGNFTQSGGTNSVSSDVNIGINFGSGTYSLSGSGLLSAARENIGRPHLLGLRSRQFHAVGRNQLGWRPRPWHQLRNGHFHAVGWRQLGRPPIPWLRGELQSKRRSVGAFLLGFDGRFHSEDVELWWRNTGGQRPMVFVARHKPDRNWRPKHRRYHGRKHQPGRESDGLWHAEQSRPGHARPQRQQHL